MITKKAKLVKVTKRIWQRAAGRKGYAKPVFIFGNQRSGTTMLFDVLNCSKEVEGYREADDEAYDNFVLKDQDTVSKLIKSSYAKIVLFKPIASSQNAQDILNRHEKSKAIWIYRHYSDAVASALKKWKEHNKYLYYILHDQKIARWRAENIPKENLILIEKFYKKGVSEESARSLIWYLRNHQYFLNKLDCDRRSLIVKYENLVTQKDHYFTSICNFLELQYKAKWANSIFSSSVNKKVNLDIDPEIQKLCDDMYQKLEKSELKRGVTRPPRARIMPR